MSESPKTRISPDVWALAGRVAEQMGLSNERAALEAVFRVFHEAYVHRASLPSSLSHPLSAHPSYPYPSGDTGSLSSSQELRFWALRCWACQGRSPWA